MVTGLVDISLEIACSYILLFPEWFVHQNFWPTCGSVILWKKCLLCFLHT